MVGAADHRTSRDWHDEQAELYFRVLAGMNRVRPKRPRWPTLPTGETRVVLEQGTWNPVEHTRVPEWREYLADSERGTAENERKT